MGAQLGARSSGRNIHHPQGVEEDRSDEVPTSAMIDTPRLMLRALEPRDVHPLYEIQRNRDAMRFTYAAPSLDECERRLHAYEALRSRLGFAPWVVVLPPGGSVIGWDGLGVDPFEPGWGVEVSYFFHPAHWGHGFATEVVRESLAHGFGQLSLTEISAFAKPDNGASTHVLEQCGFSFLRYESALGRNHYEVRRTSWDEAHTQKRA